MSQQNQLSLYCLFLSILFSALPLQAQEDQDAFMLKDIYEKALKDQYAYYWLRDLTENVGPRLSGSTGAAEAIQLVQQHLRAESFDTVFLQEVPDVPRWVRGSKEVVRIVESPSMGSIELSALSLGNSIGTPEGGVQGEVIEVQELDELDSLGREGVEGKIVFFNRPFDNSKINPSSAYGGAVDQRVYGPARAARFGALAAVVRSMTGRIDDVPHTGVTRYLNQDEQIPGIAISTKDANLLSDLLTREEGVQVYVEMDCKNEAPVNSYNVVADWKGSDPDAPYILLGAHLDSWDVGTGAHDDGAGCAHILDAVHILKNLGYQPKHSIRLVFYMNEENGLQGGRSYASYARTHQIKHLAAIESDSGGFLPMGFSCDGNKKILKKGFQQLHSWSNLMSPYRIRFTTGGSGADISPLKDQGPLLIGFRTNSQTYFDIHHTHEDVIEKVHPRELALGSAAIASLTYLLDKYGIPQ